jgi:hypothetical protein
MNVVFIEHEARRASGTLRFEFAHIVPEGGLVLDARQAEVRFDDTGHQTRLMIFCHTLIYAA